MLIIFSDHKTCHKPDAWCSTACSSSAFTGLLSASSASHRWQPLKLMHEDTHFTDFLQLLKYEQLAGDFWDSWALPRCMKQIPHRQQARGDFSSRPLNWPAVCSAAGSTKPNQEAREHQMPEGKRRQTEAAWQDYKSALSNLLRFGCLLVTPLHWTIRPKLLTC